jgi:hypothetical protein
LADIGFVGLIEFGNGLFDQRPDMAKRGPGIIVQQYGRGKSACACTDYCGVYAKPALDVVLERIAAVELFYLQPGSAGDGGVQSLYQGEFLRG